MKKLFLILGLLTITGGSLSVQSCNKVKDAILKNIDPFNFSMQSFVVTFEPTTADSINTDIVSTVINLQDSINKFVPSGVNLSISDLKEVRLNKVTVSPESGFTPGATGNNFTNIEGAFAMFNSNRGIANGLGPIGMLLYLTTSPTDEMTPLVFDYSDKNVNLLNYFHSSGETEIMYQLIGKLRRPVTAPLKVRVQVEYTIIPG